MFQRETRAGWCGRLVVWFVCVGCVGASQLAEARSATPQQAWQALSKQLQAATTNAGRLQAATKLHQFLENRPWLAATSTVQAALPGWRRAWRSAGASGERLRGQLARLLWLVVPALPRSLAAKAAHGRQWGALVKGKPSRVSGCLVAAMAAACWTGAGARWRNPCPKRKVAKIPQNRGSLASFGVGRIVATRAAWRAAQQSRRLRRAGRCVVPKAWFPHLRLALQDQRAEVRMVAAVALVAAPRFVRSPRIFRMMRLHLGGTHPVKRLAASLILAGLTKAPCPSIHRRALIGAKGAIKYNFSASAIASLPFSTQRAILHAMGRLARCPARSFFGRVIMPSDVRLLVSAMFHKESRLRHEGSLAFRRMGRVGWYWSWKGLQLKQKQTKARLAAAYAAAMLAAHPPSRVGARWKLLFGALRKERDADVRSYLVQALGHWKKAPRACWKHIASLARRDRSPRVRAAAMVALSQEPASLGLWRGLVRTRLRSRNWRVRRAALQGLAAQVKAWYKRTKARDTRMPRALFGARLLPLLQRALRDPNQRVKAAAAMASAVLRGGATPLFPQLKAMLKHPSWRLRYAAAEAFHQLGARARPAMAALVPGLADGNWGVRYSSSHALAKIGAAALPALQTSLGAASVRTRLTTTDTLLRMKPKRPTKLYLRLLAKALRDKAAIVRYAAIRGWLRWPTKASVVSLRRALRDRDWRVREVALQLLRKRPWAQQLAPDVLRTLQHKHPAVREAAAAAMVRWRGKAGQAALAKALGDRHALVRYSAAQALVGRTLSQVSAKALGAALQTPHQATQALANLALARGGRVGEQVLEAQARQQSVTSLRGAVALALWSSGSGQGAPKGPQGTHEAQLTQWRELLAALRTWRHVNPKVARAPRLLRWLNALQWSDAASLRQVGVQLQVALLRLFGQAATHHPHPQVRAAMQPTWCQRGAD